MILLQKTVTEREQDTAKHAAAIQKPEDVFPKSGLKSQCSTPILGLRNGRELMKKNVLKSLITRSLASKWNFLVTHEFLKQISSKEFCHLTFLLIQVPSY